MMLANSASLISSVEKLRLTRLTLWPHFPLRSLFGLWKMLGLDRPFTFVEWPGVNGVVLGFAGSSVTESEYCEEGSSWDSDVFDSSYLSSVPSSSSE